MPFPVHNIIPTALSKAVVPDAVESEFDHVANFTLAQTIRQMASLVQQAEDIFSDLEYKCNAIHKTTKRIKERVSQIEVVVNRFDAKEEKIRKIDKKFDNFEKSLSASGDLATFSKLKNHFNNEYLVNKELFTKKNRPQAVVKLYNRAGVENCAKVKFRAYMQSITCIKISYYQDFFSIL